MRTKPEGNTDRDGEVRLSRRLVGLHAAGLLLLILVVLSSVIWISAEHNKLALLSSESMVRAGVTSFRIRLRTLVKDYSIWDEAYEALLNDDRDWLYNNIGNAASEIGTLDLIVFVSPGEGKPFGWRSDSPPEGTDDVLPPELLAPILKMLDGAQPEDGPPTLLAEFQGIPWAFSAARVTPIAGLPAGADPSLQPIQIHGLRLAGDRLDQIGRSLLIEGLALTDGPKPGYANIALVDYAGHTLSYLTWQPPQPGARILRRVTLPLGLALLVVTMVSAISSHYAVQSARRLESALRAAKAADKSKSEFLSNVSHELRTPMNGILGVAQLLQTTNLDSEQQELLGVLFTSAHAQMALITDLLDFSKMESGTRQLVWEPFSPAAVLKDLTEMIRVAVAKKNISFESDCGALTGLVARGDERAFRQILTNLLGNAVKFTDRGGVTMQASVYRDGGRAQVTVKVSDTGRGIAPEALPHIFDRFFQADSSLTRSTEGTGLGLAISQGLARMMGGRIEVESTPGLGSTFGFSAAFDIVAESKDTLDAA